jgi:hypothetical protein
MSAAMNNFLVWRERRQARQDHERLEGDESSPTDDPQSQPEEIILTQRGTASVGNSNSGSVLVETVSEDEGDDDDDEGNDVENQNPEEGGVSESSPSERQLRRTRRTITLSDLEDERELTRRRSSACVLLAIFVLFRLWIQAITTGDFVLLIMCLMGTSWTARFIRHNREREEELDRLIADYNSTPVTEREPPGDVRFLSFQAQLALAIMESQRQMAQSGSGSNTAGVSEAAKSRWVRFEYKESDYEEGNYGSTSHSGKGDEEEPHCSICLGEYEDGEKLVRLPCGHVYHEDCVASWCENHQRCPLCNFDLESSPDESGSPSP